MESRKWEISYRFNDNRKGKQIINLPINIQLEDDIVLQISNTVAGLLLYLEEFSHEDNSCIERIVHIE